MPVPELSLKDRTELKRLADRGGRAWSDLKRAAHSFNITETTFLQMQELVAFTMEAKAIMDRLKMVEPDTSRQGILLPLEGLEPVAGKVIYTPNEPEEALEEEVNRN